jgi:hypothetical protein
MLLQEFDSIQHYATLLKSYKADKELNSFSKSKESLFKEQEYFIPLLNELVEANLKLESNKF